MPNKISKHAGTDPIGAPIQFTSVDVRVVGVTDINTYTYVVARKNWRNVIMSLFMVYLGASSTHDEYGRSVQWCDQWTVWYLWVQLDGWPSKVAFHPFVARTPIEWVAHWDSQCKGRFAIDCSIAWWQIYSHLCNAFKFRHMHRNKYWEYWVRRYHCNQARIVYHTSIHIHDCRSFCSHWGNRYYLVIVLGILYPHNTETVLRTRQCSEINAILFIDHLILTWQTLQYIKEHNVD